MYDFIRFVICDILFAESLHSNQYLTLTTAINERTGEVRDGVYEGKYHNMKFVIYPSGRVLITGSIHKYFNCLKGLGNQNYNDFSLLDVQFVLDDLHYRFGIDRRNSRLENLEFGLNLKTPFSPNVLLNSLVSYKNNSWDNMRVKGQGKGREVYLQRYAMKFYNKGLHQGQKDNILRIEKKVYKMGSIGKGIIYLADLLDADFAIHCFNSLMESFNDAIIAEPLNNSTLSKPQVKIHERCINPRNWPMMTRNQRYKCKLQFDQIIAKYGTLQLKSTITDLMKSKGKQLINTKKKVTFDPLFTKGKGDVRSIHLVG